MSFKRTAISTATFLAVIGLATSAQAGDAAAGKTVFEFDADGNGTPGEDTDLKLVIQKGAMAYGGSALMAPWPTLNEAQVGDIIAHIRSLKK